MNLQHAKLVSEAEDSYHIQMPSGRRLTVEKNKLNDKAHGIIKSLKGMQKFEDGGEVEDAAINEPMSSQAQDNPEQIAMEAGAPAAQPTMPQASGITAGVEQMAQGQPAQPEQPPMPANAQGGFEAEKKGIQDIANIEAKQGQAESKAIGDTMKQVQAMPTQEQILAKYKAKDDAFLKQLQDQKLDPNRYWNSLSTGSKIAAGIGMLLGGIGGGLSGTHQNAAAQMIQKQIDNDIEAQKNDQSKTMNLWKMNREAMGNDLAANIATQNQMYTALKFKIEQAASQFKGPLAQANAKQAVAMIQQQQDVNNFKLSMLDPNSSAPIEQRVDAVVQDAGTKDKILKEVKRAKDVRQQKKDILELYDRVSKEGPIADYKIRQADIGALTALLMTTVQEQEGSVREGAMNSVKSSYVPGFFNTKGSLKRQREGLEKYLDEKSNAPFAKSKGFDLDKEPSTTLNLPKEPIARRDKKTGKTILYDAYTKQPIGMK